MGGLEGGSERDKPWSEMLQVSRAERWRFVAIGGQKERWNIANDGGGKDGG